MSSVGNVLIYLLCVSIAFVGALNYSDDLFSPLDIQENDWTVLQLVKVILQKCNTFMTRRE